MAIRVASVGTGNCRQADPAPAHQRRPVRARSRSGVSTDGQGRQGRRRARRPRRHHRRRRRRRPGRADRGRAGLRRVLRDGRHPPGRGDATTSGGCSRPASTWSGSAPGTLQFPWGTMPDKVIDKVEARATGNATVYITGVDPGFATDLVPFALASTCQRIEQIKYHEIADYATYDGAEVMFDLMGFGNPSPTLPHAVPARRPGHRLGHRDPDDGRRPRRRGRRDHRALASRSPRPEDFDDRRRPDRQGHRRGAALPDQRHGRRPSGRSSSSTSPGPRDDLRPDWAQPAAGGGSYRVEITGEPPTSSTSSPTSSHGDHNYAAILAAAGRIVNAIPDVVAAAPGIRTTLDLPLVTGKGVVPPA